MPKLDLRGALLPITSPSGQPIEILFDFGAVNISTWTWLGQVRAVRTPAPSILLASFTFSNPLPTQLLAILNEAAVAAIGVGREHMYEIDRVSPTHRQMFYGTLTLERDIAWAVP